MKRILSLMLVATAVLMVSALPASAITSLVTNGGFESGYITGWTQSGNTQYTQVTGTPSDVHSGNFALEMGPEGSEGSLSQNLVTTPAQWYSVSYWFRTDYGYPEPINIFNVSWSGSTIFSATNLPDAPYTQYSYIVQAASSATTIGFSFQNDPGLFYLDDISVAPAVAPVPIPSTLLLMGSGLVGLLGYGRRRMKK